MLLPRPLKGLVFLLTILVAAVVYAFFLPPFLLLLCVPLWPYPLWRIFRDQYRRFTGFFEKQWMTLVVGLTENFMGTKAKIFFVGDSQPIYGENAVIISNHRCRTDWLFLWCLCLRTGQLSTLRIILKESLKSLPVVGWAMQSFLFVFLKRDRAKDLQHIENMFQYMVNHGIGVTAQIFPEGTDLSESNIIKSNRYADENNLQRYQQVLHPKVAGLAACLTALDESIDAIYDVTLGYVGYSRCSEKDLLDGRFPQEVHFLVRRYDRKDVPCNNKQDLKKWCDRAFQEKEDQLDYFYNGDATATAIAANGGKLSGVTDITSSPSTVTSDVSNSSDVSAATAAAVGASAGSVGSSDGCGADTNGGGGGLKKKLQLDKGDDVGNGCGAATAIAATSSTSGSNGSNGGQISNGRSSGGETGEVIQGKWEWRVIDLDRNGNTNTTSDNGGSKYNGGGGKAELVVKPMGTLPSSISLQMCLTECAIVYLGGFMLLVYGLWYVQWVRWYAVAIPCLFTMLTQLGGLEMIEIWLAPNNRKNKRS